MSAALAPASLAELAEAVRSVPRVLAVGAGTKPRLTQADAVKLSTLRLTGITEYEPSEFTFTALAGTPIRELATILWERGQYLPFDPMLLEAGATLGGTVASGISGPGRFRFGGIRDFILGVRFVDGEGRLLRMGGKVVKNAAGFDLPKFLVGSLGRLGVLGECTFKVFPRSTASLTLKLPVNDVSAVSRIFVEAANSRWEPDAVDLLPDGKAVCIRVVGPSQALESIAREILARWPGESLAAPAAQALWSELREFGWAHGQGVLLKVPMGPAQLPGFHRAVADLEGLRMHISSGGNVAFISLPANARMEQLDQRLCGLGMSGLAVRGTSPLWLGSLRKQAISKAVKDVLDPPGRFPALND